MAATFKLTLACTAALLVSACADQYGANSFAGNQYASDYPDYPMNGPANGTAFQPRDNGPDTANTNAPAYLDDDQAYDSETDQTAPNTSNDPNAAVNQDDGDQENTDLASGGPSIADQDNESRANALDNRDLPRFDDRRVTVDREGNGMRVGLPDQVLFARDSASLFPQARELLDAVAANLKDRYRDMDIAIKGYTDTAGSYDHNLILSEERAEAVADELIRQGVDPARIRTRGFGEDDLRVGTPDGVREPRNRRVEIVLQPANG